MDRVIVIRHGPAEDARPGSPDEARALTEGGRIVAREAFLALAARFPRPRAILASPFLRARQTAALLEEVFGGGLPVEPWLELIPSGRIPSVEAGLRARLETEPGPGSLAVVTHQPLVSELVAHLTGRRLAFPPAAWAVMAFEGGRFRVLDSSGSLP